MKIPTRTSLSRLTADAIEEAIADGMWKEKLPGSRKLCIQFSVSQRTLGTALEILTRRKVVDPADGKRARKINPNYKPSKKGNIPDRDSILFLSAQARHTTDSSSLAIITGLSDLFRQKNWTVHSEYSEEFRKAQPGPFLQQLANKYRNSRWVLTSAPQAIITWCMEQNIRAICLGGALPDPHPPTVTVSVSNILKNVISLALKNGHTRLSVICAPQSTEYANTVKQGVADALQKSSVTYLPNYHFPTVEVDDPNSLLDVLENLFKVTPPTLLIATEEKQLITIYSFCLSRGIRIPDDLSIILSISERYVDWFVPTPTHFSIPTDKMTKAIAGIIENYPTAPHKKLVIPTEFTPGHTFRAIKQ